MKRDACSMAALVEARRDGRLGDRETASLVRHLGTCPACRELERDLDEVRVLLRRPAGPTLTPLAHQRGRMALLRAAAAPPRSAPRPTRRPALVVAAVVAIAISGFSLLRPHAAPVAVAHHLPPITRSFIDPLVDAAPHRVYPAATTLHGSATARFAQHNVGQVERVSLTEGTLDLAVRKLAPGERFVVATDDAEVEVRGTEFQVEAHAGHIARIVVSEGKVEVRYRNAVSTIEAGGAWEPPQDTTAVDEPKKVLPRTPTLVAVREAAHPRAFIPSPPNPLPSNPRSEGEATASRAFGDAVDLLGRGDYAAARSQLDAFRVAHPDDGRADLAAFLTIVSLQRAGRRAEAQEAARRYLDLYPNGDRRTEAARVAGGR